MPTPMTDKLAQFDSPKPRRPRPWLCAVLGVAVSLSAGCVSMPRPVPAQQQPLAQTSVAGVVVSVPRLESGDFPGDVLDVATAVLVTIENQSAIEINVDPSAFSLGVAGGAQYSPIPAAQLAYKLTVTPLPPDTMLAWGGRGGIGVRPAPVYRAPSGMGRVYTPAPMARRSFGGYSYVPRSSYGRYPFGYIGGGPYYGWGYGGPMYWGSGYYWDGRPYAWSRADAQRLGLPSGRLPPGARMSGFLYFPRIDAQEGSALELQFTVRESAGGQVMGTAQLPLELRAD